MAPSYEAVTKRLRKVQLARATCRQRRTRTACSRSQIPSRRAGALRPSVVVLSPQNTQSRSFLPAQIREYPLSLLRAKFNTTSPTPRSAHHSASVPCKSSPRTRKSNGTGCGRFRTRLISWLSWNRRQPVGSMYCCEGIAYSVRVVKTTGCCVVVTVAVAVAILGSVRVRKRQCTKIWRGDGTRARTKTDVDYRAAPNELHDLPLCYK